MAANPRRGLVARSVLLGWAAGARSSLGPGAVTATSRRPALVRVGAVSAIVGELVGDKLPSAPSRLDHGGGAVRAGAGAIGASLLAGRYGARPFAPAIAGAVAGLSGAYVGAAWRRWAVGRMPDWQAALLEDAVAIGAAAVAVLPGRRR